MDLNKKIQEGSQGILIFKIGTKEYCIDISNLKAVIRINDVKFIFNNYVNDQIEYENQRLKIIDIHNILNNSMAEFTEDTRIILVEAFGKTFSFISDKILEILTIGLIFMDNTLDLIPSAKEKYISGALMYQKRKIYFLNFEKLCKDLSDLKKFNFSQNHIEKLSLLFS